MLPEYIPTQPGQMAFLKEKKILSPEIAGVGYEVVGGHVVFSEDITDFDQKRVKTVDMRLVVMDFDQYSDYDMLPLPANMAVEVVQEVYAILMQTPPPDTRVDPKVEENINKR